MSSKNSFKNKVTDQLFTNKSHLHTHEQDLELNNPQGLTCL